MFILFLVIIGITITTTTIIIVIIIIVTVTKTITITKYITITIASVFYRLNAGPQTRDGSKTIHKSVLVYTHMYSVVVTVHLSSY